MGIEQRPRRAHGWILLISVACVSCSRSPEYYVTKGNQLAAKGNYADASITYRKALQKNPRFEDAYLHLGLAELAQGHISAAGLALLQCRTLNPNNLDCLVPLGDIFITSYLQTGSSSKPLYDQLTEISNRLLKKDPNSYDGLRFKGYLKMTDGKRKEAIELFRAADRRKPGTAKVILALVRTLLEDGQYEEGEKLALTTLQNQRSMALEEQWGAAYDLLYRFYMSKGRTADAENLLKLKVERNPRSVIYIMQLALHYAKAQKPAEMQAALQPLLDRPADFPNSLLQVGNFYMGLHNWDQAMRYYREGAAKDAKLKILYQGKILDVLDAQGKRAEELQLAGEILKANPQEDGIRLRRAALYLDNPTPENVNAALAEYNALLARHRDDQTIPYGLGRVYMAKGDLDTATKEFLESIRLRNTYLPPRKGLIEISLQKHDYPTMIRYSGEVLSVEPQNTSVMYLRSLALTGLGLFEEARKELADLLKIAPDSREAQFQLGVLDIREKRYQDAEATFRKFYQPGQVDSQPARGLAEVYAAQGQFDKALQIWTDELKIRPRPETKQALADMAMRAEKYDLAIAQYKDLVANDPASPDIYLHYAQALDSKADTEPALAIMQAAKGKWPQNVAVMRYLAYLLLKDAHYSEAESVYREVYKASSDDPQVMNDLAYAIAMRAGGLDEALNLAQQASRKLPGNAVVSDTLGYIYLQKKMVPSALQIFQALVRKNPEQALFRYHMAMALVEMGDKAQAKIELKNALTNSPSSVEAQQIKALLSKIG